MSVLPFRKREKTDLVTRSIDAFESETVGVLAAEKPKSERIIFYVIVVMVLVFILMASLIKVDEVAEAPGQIVPAGGTIVVQPLETAVIKTIDVKLGDKVKKGQVLATLDPTFATADLKQLQEKEQSLAAEVARLEAEHDRKPFAPSADNPYMQMQAVLWQQRQSEYNSSITDFDQRQQAAEAQIAGIEHDMTLVHSRLGLAGDIENMRTELEKRDVGSRLNSLMAQDSRLQDAQSLASDESNLAATRHTLESLKAQRSVFVQQWDASIGSDLVQRSSDLVSARQYLSEAQELKDLVELRAPQDGTVLDAAQLSIGSVAQAGNPIFTLVPEGSELQAEIYVTNLDVGFVKKGDPVSIRLDTFPFMRHGQAHGIVDTVTQDAFTTMPDGSTVPPYYKVRVKITDTKLHDVPPDFRLFPGMTLEGDVVLGKRTILTYITDSFMKVVHTGAREPE
jgi:HlyD family type I secretion membrane fusion protein